MAKVKEKKRKESRVSEIWRRLKKNRGAVISMFLILALVLVAIFADVIAPYAYDEQNYDDSYAPHSARHLLGADKLGRDMLSRLIYGARQSLMIGVFSVAISAILGMFFGALAGYFGGWVDNVLMRFLDIYQSIPMMLMCIVLSAVLGPSLRNTILALGISMIPQFARLMRASILPVRNMEYVEAAQSINAGHGHIILKYIIPNAISPMIVSITMYIGSAILIGAMMSFIGLGVQPPLPEWGTLISDGRNVMRGHPTLALYPGLCIMITVLAFNLLGDGLRDALDPRLKN